MAFRLEYLLAVTLYSMPSYPTSLLRELKPRLETRGIFWKRKPQLQSRRQLYQVPHAKTRITYWLSLCNTSNNVNSELRLLLLISLTIAPIDDGKIYYSEREPFLRCICSLGALSNTNTCQSNSKNVEHYRIISLLALPKPRTDKFKNSAPKISKTH